MKKKKIAPDYIYSVIAALLYAQSIAEDVSHAGMAVEANKAIRAIRAQYEIDPLKLDAAKEDAAHCARHTAKFFNFR